MRNTHHAIAAANTLPRTAGTNVRFALVHIPGDVNTNPHVSDTYVHSYAIPGQEFSPITKTQDD